MEFLDKLTENREVLAAAAAVVFTLLLIRIWGSSGGKKVAGVVDAKFKRLTTPGSNKIILATMTQKSAFPHASPFVAKLDAILRHANVDFSVTVVDHSQLPTSKIPVLHWNGEILSDSQLIVARLVQEKIMEHPNAWMDNELKAKAEMLRLSFENHIYYRIVMERWTQNWEKTKAEYFSDMPWLIYKFVPDWFIQPDVALMLNKNGTTRYSDEAWRDMEAEFWKNSSVLLGNKKYFFSNEELCMADLTAFGVMVNVLGYPELNPKLCASLRKHDNLVKFVERISGKLYGDL